MINDYFVNKVELDDQGYANIYVNKFLPYYNEKYLFCCRPTVIAEE